MSASAGGSTPKRRLTSRSSITGAVVMADSPPVWRRVRRRFGSLWARALLDANHNEVARLEVAPDGFDLDIALRRQARLHGNELQDAVVLPLDAG